MPLLLFCHALGLRAVLLQKTQAGPYYVGLGASLGLRVTPHEHKILGRYFEIEVFCERVSYPTFGKSHQNGSSLGSSTTTPSPNPC